MTNKAEATRHAKALVTSAAEMIEQANDLLKLAEADYTVTDDLQHALTIINRKREVL